MLTAYRELSLDATCGNEYKELATQWKECGLALGALWVPVHLIERFLDMVFPEVCEWIS